MTIENVLIAAIVIGTVLGVLVNRGRHLELEVNDRHYYSRWARPFRYPRGYTKIDPSLTSAEQRAEWRARRRLQRQRRALGQSIHDPS